MAPRSHWCLCLLWPGGVYIGGGVEGKRGGEGYYRGNVINHFGDFDGT